MLDKPHDILEDTAEPGRGYPSIDDQMADDLFRGDIVFIDNKKLRFEDKPTGEPHRFYNEDDKKLEFIWTRDLLQIMGEGRYFRPGRSTPSLDEEIATDKNLKHEQLERMRRAFLAFREKPRAKAKAKWLYVSYFLNQMQLAKDNKTKFDRNHDNAEIVIKAVDRIIDEQNKMISNPGKWTVKPTGRSSRSLLRWVARELDMKIQESSLLHFNAVKKHARKLPQKVFDIIAEQIRHCVNVSAKLGPTKISIVVDGAIDDYNRKNKAYLPKPKLTTIQNEYRRFDAWIRLAKEKGVKAADLEYGAVGKLERPARILDLVELDHHKFDLRGIFGKTPLGKVISTTGLDRFWICLALDVHSGYPLGFAITFEPGGLLPALMCIDHCIRPKPYVHQRWPNINGELLAFGKPVRFRYDNAKEFVSLQLQGALARIGVGFQMSVPGEPQTKPYVERHFGTIERDFVHWLKGTTGSSPKDKIGRNPVKEAIIPWDDFVRLFHQYLIECYARRKQPDLDWQTPEQRWVLGTNNPAHRPRLLTKYEQERWDIVNCIELDVKATREGFVWRHLHFNSDELQTIRRNAGYHGMRDLDPTPLKARIPLLDVGIAYVADPTRPDPRKPDAPSEIPVPCKNPHARNRTIWQHEAVCEELRTKQKSLTSHPDYRAGFLKLFRESIKQMGVTPVGDPPQEGWLTGGRAPRNAGVFLAGFEQHALKRTEDTMEEYDILGEFARAAAAHQAEKEREEAEGKNIPDLPDLPTDRIKLDDDEDEDDKNSAGIDDAANSTKTTVGSDSGQANQDDRSSNDHGADK
jgi:putative transposase